MLVNAVLVPPASVLDEVGEVVGRHLRTGHDGIPVLVATPPGRLLVPITEFGNLTGADATRLAEAIGDAASSWSVPTVRFAGGGALEFPGDPSVWARLDGDLDELTAIARGVTRCVERLGLFVDRRLFRPMLAVATVTESTTGTDLEEVVASLEGFRSSPWRVDEIVLTTAGYEAESAQAREFRRLGVGSR